MQLSLCKNNLLRMYGLSRLHMLQEMNLSNNAIVTIEGLKDLVHLRHLDLHGNKIKTVEHLNANVQLEYLNLSENCIGTISDISMLKNLKVSRTVQCVCVYFYVTIKENKKSKTAIETNGMLFLKFENIKTHR